MDETKNLNINFKLQEIWAFFKFIAPAIKNFPRTHHFQFPPYIKYIFTYYHLPLERHFVDADYYMSPICMYVRPLLFLLPFLSSIPISKQTMWKKKPQMTLIIICESKYSISRLQLCPQGMRTAFNRFLEEKNEK